ELAGGVGGVVGTGRVGGVDLLDADTDLANEGDVAADGVNAGQVLDGAGLAGQSVGGRGAAAGQDQVVGQAEVAGEGQQVQGGPILKGGGGLVGGVGVRQLRAQGLVVLDGHPPRIDEGVAAVAVGVGQDQLAAADLVELATAVDAAGDRQAVVQ